MTTMIKCECCDEESMCVYEAMLSYFITPHIYCEECKVWREELDLKNNWKPDENCDCDCCDNARYFKRPAVPNQCELYPYWTFSKIKTK